MNDPTTDTQPAPAACGNCGAADGRALDWMIEGVRVCADCRPSLDQRTQLRIAEALERIADALVVERTIGKATYSFSVASTLDCIADRLDR